MRQPIFKGIATALITPFRDGQVDYEAMGRLIDWLRFFKFLRHLFSSRLIPNHI